MLLAPAAGACLPRARAAAHRRMPRRSLGCAQGTGKTTAAGKLALYLKKKGLKVLLVATDVYRPGGWAVPPRLVGGWWVDVWVGRPRRSSRLLATERAASPVYCG